MAETNGTTLVLEPERKLAKALRLRHNLQPPIDIEAILASYAELEVATFPTTCDCLLIRKPNRKPLLIVSAITKQNENRYRFTLAHELGHLILPWQGGSIFCHANFSVHISDSITDTLEAEANRFASELLIPSDWVAALIANKSPTLTLSEQIRELARRAGVSPITATFTVARVLPPDHLLVIVLDDKAAYVAISPGSAINAPHQGMYVESATKFINLCTNAGGQCSISKIGPMELVAVMFPAKIPLPISTDIGKLSTDLLRDMLLDVEPDSDLRKKMMMSANGIIGSANNSTTNSEDALYRRFQQKFVARPDLGKLLAHSRFNEFLAIKARELCNKKRISEGTH